MRVPCDTRNSACGCLMLIAWCLHSDGVTDHACRYTNTGSGIGATRHCSVKGGPFDGLEYREVKVGEGSTGGYSYTIDQVSWPAYAVTVL